MSKQLTLGFETQFGAESVSIKTTPALYKVILSWSSYIFAGVIISGLLILLVNRSMIGL